MPGFPCLLWLGVLALGILALDAGQANAAAYRVDARTEASFYELRSYRQASGSAPAFLPRRRIVQHLGLGAFELVKDHELDFDSDLRLHTDLGASFNDAARLDGRQAVDADLLYAALSWRNVKNVADFKLGRQIMVDELDYLPFDGLRARLRTPFFVSLELYGGLMVTGTSFLGSGTFAPDGTRESDERRLLLGNPDADRELGALEPVFGAKLSASDFRWGEVRVGYRRALLLPTGRATAVDPYGKPEVRTDLERLGAGLDLRPWGGLKVYSAIDWDLFLQRLGQGRVGARWDAAGWSASAEAMRLAPILSADSIWAYFATGARDEARVRFGLHPAEWPVQPHLEALAQRFRAELQSSFQRAVATSPERIPTNLSQGLGGGVRLAPQLGRAALDFRWRNGYGGRQLWLDATTGHDFVKLPLTIDLRVNQAFVRDGFNPLIEGASTGVQLLARYRLIEEATLTAIAEENFGSFSRSDFRVYGIIDVRADL